MSASGGFELAPRQITKAEATKGEIAVKPARQPLPKRFLDGLGAMKDRALQKLHIGKQGSGAEVLLEGLSNVSPQDQQSEVDPAVLAEAQAKANSTRKSVMYTIPGKNVDGWGWVNPQKQTSTQKSVKQPVPPQREVQPEEQVTHGAFAPDETGPNRPEAQKQQDATAERASQLLQNDNDPAVKNFFSKLNHQSVLTRIFSREDPGEAVHQINDENMSAITKLLGSDVIQGVSSGKDIINALGRRVSDMTTRGESLTSIFGEDFDDSVVFPLRRLENALRADASTRDSAHLLRQLRKQDDMTMPRYAARAVKELLGTQ